MEPVVTARVIEYVRDAVFPISKKKVITYAKMHHVPENLLASLEKLPDREYKNFNDLKKTLESIPFDDGVPKKTKDRILQEKDDRMQQMDNLVNPREFTQMGDEQNYEA